MKAANALAIDLNKLKYFYKNIFHLVFVIQQYELS